jgi:hypothetical protein
VIKALSFVRPPCCAKSEWEMFVSVSRSKHAQRQSKRLPKRESKKTTTKPEEILFFFSVKIPRWYKCKLLANLGAFARGCGKAVKHSISSQMSPKLWC